jgi:uncharacterized protein YkwD
MTRAAMLLVFGLAAFLTVQAQTSASVAEVQLFTSVNRARRAQGLPALKWNDALAAAACGIDGAARCGGAWVRRRA